MPQVVSGTLHLLGLAIFLLGKQNNQPYVCVCGGDPQGPMSDLQKTLVASQDHPINGSQDHLIKDSTQPRHRQGSWGTGRLSNFPPNKSKMAGVCVSTGPPNLRLFYSWGLLFVLCPRSLPEPFRGRTLSLLSGTGNLRVSASRPGIVPGNRRRGRALGQQRSGRASHTTTNLQDCNMSLEPPRPLCLCDP